MITVTINEFLNSMGSFMLGTWEIPWLGLILFVVIFSLIIIFYRVIVRYLKKQVRWRGNSPNFYNGVKFLLRVGVLIIVVIVAVNLLNIESNYVLMISGVFITALAFASMKSINNIMAGIYIALTRPFTVGDYIKIGHLEGIVTEISLNRIKVKHRDASISLVPNLTCLNSEIHNYTISVEWYRDHINLLEKSIEKSYHRRKKKHNEKEKRKDTEKNFHNEKLTEELKELKSVMVEIENVQENFIKMKEDEEHRERTARERRRKEREKKRTIKMQDRADYVFEISEKKEKNKRKADDEPKTVNQGKLKDEEDIPSRIYDWPAYSIYVDDDRIVRYTFTLKLPKEPDRNAKILSAICKEWADEFEMTPRWRISGLGARIEYEFIILTPDPYDIIHFYDEFIENVYKEIYDRSD